MADDHATRWMKEESNAKSFCTAVGANANFRNRIHNLIAFNVPITMEPDNPTSIA